MAKLGIEIGGTKLQLGVGEGDGRLLAFERREIDAKRGAEAILASILEASTALFSRFDLDQIGVGFGGPVQAGVTLKSHQVEGWEGFPLSDWCERRLGAHTVVANDCDAAALAEARHGAGRGARTVFYVTVGTGVGGGLVIDGQIHGMDRPAVAEIGHLRPGLQADRPEQTVESVASGWGIAAEAIARAQGDVNWPVHQLGASANALHDPQQRRREIEASDELRAEYAADLLHRCGGDFASLTAVHVAAAAADGNQLAADSLDHAISTLGWAIAQMITLTSAERVVVGGGVSLLGEARFLQPLRRACQQYVFPPLTDAYEIRAVELGEEVVVHGAIALTLRDYNSAHGDEVRENDCN